MIFNISKKTYKLFRDVVAFGLSIGLTFSVFAFELEVLGKDEKISQTQNALTDSMMARFREHAAYVRGANQLKRKIGEENAQIVDMKQRLHDKDLEIVSLQKALQDRDLTIHMDGHAIGMYKLAMEIQGQQASSTIAALQAENSELGDETERLKHQLRKFLEEIYSDDDDDEPLYREDPLASNLGR